MFVRVGAEQLCSGLGDGTHLSYSPVIPPQPCRTCWGSDNSAHLLLSFLSLSCVSRQFKPGQVQVSLSPSLPLSLSISLGANLIGSSRIKQLRTSRHPVSIVIHQSGILCFSCQQARLFCLLPLTFSAISYFHYHYSSPPLSQLGPEPG